MKRFMFLLFVLLVLANSMNVNAEEWQYTAESMEASLNITTGVKIIPQSGSWEVKDLLIELSLWPRASNYQRILEFNEEPKAEVDENNLLFKFKNVKEQDINVNINSVVQVKENRPQIKNKVSFPIINLEKDYRDYIQSTEKINVDNENIINLASTIVEGEDDLFFAVYLIGEWVKENVEYKLDEYTELNVMDSDWIFQNRYGACDEISTLFITMVRSLGIPARYVGGYAYTDLDNIERFESHAWAEVYFPGYGWVPYDITYGQFGFIDISHINLGEKICPSEKAVKIELTGRDVDIESKKIDINVIVNDLNGKVNSNVIVDAELLKNNVDFGSYNIINVKVKNQKNYYLTLPIYISNNIKVDLFEENIKYIVLKPYEEKTIYWKIKVNDDLRDGYYYTFPFYVYSLDGERKELNLMVKKGEYYLSEKDVDSMIDELREERTKTYSSDVSIECVHKEYAYSYENISINCLISNTGNKFLKDLEICGPECEIFDLGIGQKINIDYSMIAEKNMKISISNKDVSKVKYLDIDYYDIPSIELFDLIYPKNVSYDDEFNVDFGIRKNSNSVPKNIVVDLGGKINKFTLKDLESPQYFKIKLKGSNLEEGENNIRIYIEFEDENTRKYDFSKEIMIKLENVNFIQKIKLFLIKINNWVSKI